MPKLGMIALTYSPSTQKADAGEIVVSLRILGLRVSFTAAYTTVCDPISKPKIN